MFLNTFFTEANQFIQVTPQQASDFAKQVADDFNPIHDPDAKRFCVPGDLLFSLVLSKYGINQRMCFTFGGMVGKGIDLIFPPTDEKRIEIKDAKGKTYLTVDREGDNSKDEKLIDSFAKGYVAFSGHNFPHTLVPLMAEKQVMINADRPLVIYEKMSVEMDTLDVTAPSLEQTDSTLEVNGKRGDVSLHFKICSEGKNVGKGVKKLVLSGLRPFEQASLDNLVEKYMERKRIFAAQD